MKALFLKTLSILLAIAVVVLLYYVCVWVLGLLGIHVPGHILTVIFVILGLVAAIWVISGRADNLWKSGGA